ncbi:MAG: hypothetical protein KC620_21150 [Myxococcales bacterium]|nr:hypothetical protein [Myxococcales bacterium]
MTGAIALAMTGCGPKTADGAPPAPEATPAAPAAAKETPQGEARMKRPPVQAPNGAWLVYENLALDDADRSGNHRFAITRDGCFWQARNGELFITDKARLNSDDPADHWNKPLPSKPQRCLTAEQVKGLEAAITAADFGALKPLYATAPEDRSSHPALERWTLIGTDGKQTQVEVEDEATPAALKTLRSAIDALIAAAPKTE